MQPILDRDCQREGMLLNVLNFARAFEHGVQAVLIAWAWQLQCWELLWEACIDNTWAHSADKTLDLASEHRIALMFFFHITLLEAYFAIYLPTATIFYQLSFHKK
eukprot:TRINITY_DN5497_c0_g1_i2.p1 TRINITY_DN5497_c0_g1~~TRINITY_DN5497_c0_g1_i2.p1  ORF type:complete len:105 (-),score=7.80 TRINITY_DN5497_c0_g1_i2:855-1169(-)